MNTHGGARPGAGRKKIGKATAAKMRALRATDAEWVAIKAYAKAIKAFRKNKN